jgi:hypothetical protein
MALPVFDVANIRIEPVDLYLGKDQKQVQKVTTVADVSSSLNNKYFALHSAAGGKHLVWFDTGTGVAPVISGYTAVQVTIAVNATAAAVATALQTAVDALTDYVATVSGKVVTITDNVNGPAHVAADAEVTLSKTGFAFEYVTAGDLMERVGYMDGDVEISGLSQEMLEVTAHQTGVTSLAQLLTSAGKPEISANLKEVISEVWQKLRRYSSGTYLPQASGSTPIVGNGTAGLFKAMKNARVILHPVSKDFADHTADLALWKCNVDLDTVTYSGENILTLPIKIMANNDSSKPAAVSMFQYGDWTQIETV